MKMLKIISVVIVVQVLLLTNLSAKTYLGVTAPIYTLEHSVDCSKNTSNPQSFEGECYEPIDPQSSGYTILFGFLNFGLFYLNEEIKYGADNKIEWQMKNELTGIYFGYVEMVEGMSDESVESKLNGTNLSKICSEGWVPGT